MTTITVYGIGCANCKRLESLCREAIDELHLDAVIEKETDMKKIVESGILSTPGLAINGTVVSAGKIPTKQTLINWIGERSRVGYEK